MKVVITAEGKTPDALANLIRLALSQLMDIETLQRADKGEPVEIALPSGKASLVFSEME